MRFPFTIILALLALVSIGVASPKPAQAAEPALVLEAGQSRSLAEGSYSFSNITVGLGASLYIGQGVTITLSSGGMIRVYGVLSSVGTATNPVVVRGVESKPWLTLEVMSGGVVQLVHTELNYYAGPVLFHSPHIALQSVIFSDARDGQVIVGASTDHWQDAVLSWVNITFKGRSNRTLDLGIVVNATFDTVSLTKVTFIDSRRTTQRFIGVRSAWGSGSVQYTAVQHASCQLTASNIYSVSYALRLVTCEVPVLPVVFIPGFGGSINLKVLASPLEDREIDRDNWQVPLALAPAYYAFFDALTSISVPFEVAEYDWRLPPEQIVNDYLIPTINDLTARTGSNQVRIVAHSYGGLVAQAYMRTDLYRGDVASVSLLGTPTGGVTAAYRAWYGGEIQPGFSALANLLKWWRYRESMTGESTENTIRRNVPSLQSLLPRYPFLFQDGQVHELEYEPDFRDNPWPQQVDVIESVAGYGHETEEWIKVGTPAGPWVHGLPLNDPSMFGPGDSLVPATSAYMSGGVEQQVDSDHGDIPRKYLETYISRYYPDRPLKAQYKLGRDIKDMLWWVFDCDIVAEIVLPDGQVVSSETASEMVLQGGGITWIFTEKMPGEYRLKITAQSSGEVRWWRDEEPISTKHFLEGEVLEVPVLVEGNMQATPTPTPTVSAQVKSTSIKSPSPKSDLPSKSENEIQASNTNQVAEVDSEFVQTSLTAELRRTKRLLSVSVPGSIFPVITEQEKQQIEHRIQTQLQLPVLAILLTLTLLGAWGVRMILRKLFRHVARLPP